MRYDDEEGRRGAPPGRLPTGLVPPTAAPPTRSALDATLDPPEPSRASVVGTPWPSTVHAPQTRLPAGRSPIDVNTPTDGRREC